LAVGQLAVGQLAVGQLAVGQLDSWQLAVSGRQQSDVPTWSEEPWNIGTLELFNPRIGIYFKFA
jgi:hypothetical protein